MNELQDDYITCIEKEIAWTYFDALTNYPNSDGLLRVRKKIINQRAMSHLEEILPDVIAFDDALTVALRQMYQQAHRIWDGLNALITDERIVLTAKCCFSSEYPALHPVQSGKNRQFLWNALCDREWNSVYRNGVTSLPLTLPENDDCFEIFIGKDCPPSYWNMRLDPNLKDMHLTCAFHHLFYQTAFAITDFIYVRKFDTEINN